MRLLVVGGSGFIGLNFLLSVPKKWEVIATYNQQNRTASILGNRCPNVNLAKCDLTSETDVKQLANKVGKKPINVLYLAGNTDPQFSYKNPKEDLQKNAIGLINLLQHINADRFVYFSSGAVYTGLRGKVDPTVKLNPTLPYAISKLMCEQYIKYFTEIGKIRKYVIVRFFGAYGPYEPERKIYTKLVRGFYLNKQKEFTVYGNDKNLIDAVYVDEVVKAIFKILASKNGNIIIDLCHAKPISIDKLVKVAASVFGIKKLLIRHSGKSAEPIHFKPSQAGMKKHFGITFKDNLRESLRKFATHFKNY